MNLTEQDKEMIKNLKESSIGRQLVSYLDRMCNFICDSRNWNEEDSKESSLHAERIIRELLINKIRVQNNSINKINFDYE